MPSQSFNPQAQGIHYSLGLVPTQFSYFLKVHSLLMNQLEEMEWEDGLLRRAHFLGGPGVIDRGLLLKSAPLWTPWSTGSNHTTAGRLGLPLRE